MTTKEKKALTAYNLRLIGVRALCAVVQDGKKLDLAIEASIRETIGDEVLNEPDQAFLFELVYGVLRRYFLLEKLVKPLVKKAPDIEVSMAIYVGAYQLFWMRVPNHAAIYETVEAAKKINAKIAGMVNAVLRNLLRKGQPKNDKLHAELKPWQLRRFEKVFTHERLKPMYQAMLTKPELSLFVPDEGIAPYKAELESAGIKHSTGRLCGNSIIVHEVTDPTQLPGYEDGRFWVMDQSSALAAQLLVKQTLPSGPMLDLCAAPGGKSAVLGVSMDRTVIANDRSVRRLQRIRDNIARLKLSNVFPVNADGMRPAFKAGSFTGVLLDAPCSASGVYRKHPDAKFLHSEEDLKRLQTLQQQLLIECYRLLKPGGVLVYSVCSVYPDENEDVLRVLEPFLLTPVRSVKALYKYQTAPGQWRIPATESNDGFFMAGFIKGG